MVREDLNFGRGDTIQYIGDGSMNYKLETYIIILTNVTLINLIKLKNNEKIKGFFL